MMQTAANKWL